MIIYDRHAQYCSMREVRRGSSCHADPGGGADGPWRRWTPGIPGKLARSRGLMRCEEVVSKQA